MEKLIKGVAYHGNRMLSHIHEDMKDIVNHGFNAILHMFSHNDWDRHKKIMKEIRRYGVRHVKYGNSDEMSHAIGSQGRNCFAICDDNFSEVILNEINRNAE